MRDPLERIIRPIVEGQVRDYMNHHPDAICEKFPGQVVGGIGKRITHDILANRDRIRAALELATEAAEDGVKATASSS